MLNSVLRILIVTISCVVALVSLDYFAGKVLSFLSVLYIMLLCLIIICAKRRAIWWWCIGILQALALWHIGYFGSEVFPEQIMLASENVNENATEVLFSTVQHIHRLWIGLLLTPVVYGILYIWIKRQNIRLWFADMLFIIIISVVIIRAVFYPSLYLLYPHAHYPSFFNVLNSFAIAGLRPLQIIKTNYLPYHLHFTVPKAKNIILVMGESVSSDYMQLFGYKYANTPYLQKLAESKAIYYQKGYAGAVMTNVALNTFFNLIYEPNNFHLMNNQHTNLFHLAKQQGYKTFLISMQSASLFYGIGLNNIDVLKTKEDFPPHQYQGKRDELLLEELAQLPLGEKNFIVLHQRNIHSPYEENYQHLIDWPNIGETEGHIINTYNNAMLLNDKIWHDIIAIAKNKVHDGYVFFTSDHAEMLGEEGRYGHGHLHVACAKVPFIIAPLQYEEQQYMVNTHWQLGLLIAEKMGVIVNNPNYNSDKHYIHGFNLQTDPNYLSIDLLN